MEAAPGVSDRFHNGTEELRNYLYTDRFQQIMESLVETDMASAKLFADVKRAIDLLLKVVQHLEITEHVSGRIKMRLPLANVPQFISLVGELDISNVAPRVPGLKSYRLNPFFMSGTIEYEPSIIPHDLWEDLFKLKYDQRPKQSLRDRLLEIMKEDRKASEGAACVSEKEKLRQAGFEKYDCQKEAKIVSPYGGRTNGDS